MPRPPRELKPGGIYHVTARGNRKQRIFLADDDRRFFLTLLDRIAARLRWICHAYCLMENHYHLLVETPGADLSTGLQLLNGRYAQTFNARYSLTGHLFQGRFHSVVVRTDEHLFELTRYLALNPVRAGLCARPEQWPWSSYRAVIGATPEPPFLKVDRLLEFFGAHPVVRRERLHRFVHDARPIPLEDLAARAMAGVRPRTGPL